MAAMLNYCETQILEVFKTLCLSLTLVWVSFPTDNLRLTVEAAKWKPTKEMLDRTLYNYNKVPSSLVTENILLR